MIYTQSSQNQNDSFYQQPGSQDQYYGSNPDLIPIKNFGGSESSVNDSQQQQQQQQPLLSCSELDSTLLLGKPRPRVSMCATNVGNVGNAANGKRQSQHVP